MDTSSHTNTYFSRGLGAAILHIALVPCRACRIRVWQNTPASARRTIISVLHSFMGQRLALLEQLAAAQERAEEAEASIEAQLNAFVSGMVVGRSWQEQRT